MMINDLETNCKTIKYVDDTTLYHVSSNTADVSLQQAVDTAANWSSKNDMRLNASKTKEILISFAKIQPDVSKIVVDNTEVERVTQFTLLGLKLSASLNWEEHCSKIIKRANTRLFFLKQLKRAKVPPKDIVASFISVVRPILEYACQVWHPGLTIEQHDLLENIQARALKIAYPTHEYSQALKESDIPTLKARRTDLCKRLFNDMQKESHMIHDLLPMPRDNAHSTRHATKYPLPRVKTERFKKSFLNYCLFNFQ